MEIQIPKLNPWAWAAIGALAIYGVNRGVSDVTRAAGGVVGDVADRLGSLADSVGDVAEDAADEVKRKWRNAGQGARSALPWVVAGTALILWARRK